MVVSLTTQIVQLITLATAFSLHTPTDLLFYSLLPLKYYFSFFFFFIIFCCQHLIKEKTNIYIKSFIKTKKTNTYKEHSPYKKKIHDIKIIIDSILLLLLSLRGCLVNPIILPHTIFTLHFHEFKNKK